MYKKDEGQKNVIAKNTHIYPLVHCNQSMSLLQYGNIHYKTFIRKKELIRLKKSTLNFILKKNKEYIVFRYTLPKPEDNVY